MANIEEKVESLISDTIKNLGYELYDVIYEKEAQDYYLRVFIDKPEGISLDDCEKVNDSINDMLDKADYIKEQYFLEVSSPGIERVLRKDKHLQSAIGKEITCNLFHPIIIKDDDEEITEKSEKANQKNNSKKKKQNKKEKSFKQIEGILQSFDENNIVLNIQLEGKNKNESQNNQKKGKEKGQLVEMKKANIEVKIERKNIAVIKLKYNWE